MTDPAASSTPETPTGGMGRVVRAGLAWSTLSFVVAKLVSLLSLLVLARLLAPAQFGVVAAIVVFLALIELGSDLGMKATVIYEQQEGITERVQTAFTLNLIISGALAVVGILLAPLIARFFHLEHHIGLFQLGALNVLLTGMGNVQDGLLLRDMKWRRRIISEVVRAIVRAVVSIVLALAGLGGASLVWGMLVGTGVWTVLQWGMTGLRPTFRLNRSIARNMLGYGSGASALSVIAVVSTRVDTAVIARVLGDRALGLYTVAYRVPELLIGQVASNLSLVAFPALARKRVLDEEGLAPATMKLIRYQALYALPLAAGMALLAPALTNVLFSSKWLDSAGVLAPVAVMTAFQAAVFPLGDAFKAVGRQRVLVTLNLIQLPILVAAIVLAAPAGIVAVGWSRAGGGALWAVMMGVSVARLLNITPLRLIAAVGPGLAAAGGVVLGAGAVRIWSGAPTLASLVAGTAAAALGGLVALRVLSPQMFAEVVGQFGALARTRLRRRRGASSGQPPTRTDSGGEGPGADAAMPLPAGEAGLPGREPGSAPAVT